MHHFITSQVKVYYQLKIDNYIYKMFDVILMITTKKKPMIDTQKIMKSKHTS